MSVAIQRRSAYSALVKRIKSIYGENREILLHRPVFGGSEIQNLRECIESNYVSSVGANVTEFEDLVAKYTGSNFGVAVVNGTNALQVALRVVDVASDTEVITQPLTFVATCNAISYLGAMPIFVDVDRDTMGMSPDSLATFLQQNARLESGGCVNINTGRRIAACVPMHTFGHPCRIDEIVEVCTQWQIPVVEDSAESLGSNFRGKHTATTGRLGVFSFNGNKIITTGGGGMIVTDEESLAARAKHLTTTAKLPHDYEYIHDELGYNFRMPNLNAAVGCAQMSQLPEFIFKKREVASQYEQICHDHDINFVSEPKHAISNYWLNAIILHSREERDVFLRETNDDGIMTRPIWRLMIDLPMYKNCHHDGVAVARWLGDRLVCLPSSVP